MLAEPPKFGGYGPGEILGDDVIAARSDPADGGRVSLWRLPAREELTPHNYVRTAIHEYGGGEWAVASFGPQKIIVYSDFPSNDLRIIVDGRDELLVSGGNERYGGLTIDVPRKLILAVREDHSGDSEPIDAIVSIDISDYLTSDSADDAKAVKVSENNRVTELVSGADFYASPTLSSDGRLAWVQWNHPNMPWDTTELLVAPIANPSKPELIAGGHDESVQYPTWAPDGSLVFLSDRTGFWNFYRYDGHQTRALHNAPYDFTHPMWVLDSAPYSVIRADQDGIEIGCMWLEDGMSKIGVLRCDQEGRSELAEIPTEAVAASIRGQGPRSTVLLSYPDRLSELAIVDWDAQKVTPLPLPEDPDKPDLTGYISYPQLISWESPHGTVHAWYYPPTNKDYQAPAGELPPVQVLSHGGPTSNSMPTYSLGDVQFWTSRGIGVLDVNYSGSSGYGRAYRERLKGNWGLLDVEDCATGVAELVRRGLADPKRISIKGGSAGGFTTLASLAFTDTYAAGISLFGIGDLEILAKDTHKFESRYLDGLVAPYPEGREIYLERSPSQHLDRLSAPMLILQGLDDKVVPPTQAYAMADAVGAKGLPVSLITFEGEGHGFRKAETIIVATEAALEFLGSVHDFEPAE